MPRLTTSRSTQVPMLRAPTSDPVSGCLVYAPPAAPARLSPDPSALPRAAMLEDTARTAIEHISPPEVPTVCPRSEWPSRTSGPSPAGFGPVPQPPLHKIGRLAVAGLVATTGWST